MNHSSNCSVVSLQYDAVYSCLHRQLTMFLDQSEGVKPNRRCVTQLLFIFSKVRTVCARNQVYPRVYVSIFTLQNQQLILVNCTFLRLHDSESVTGCYSQAQRALVGGALEGVASCASALMKVWLMVLTEIPYSSTSALRQSKKACTACLEAASSTHI